MSRVNVSTEILNWAMNRSGFNIDHLEKKIPQFKKWITGETAPTLKQLEKLSKITFTPLGFFFLAAPPEEKLPIPHYRTIKDKISINPSPDLFETIQICQRRQDWMREYLQNHHQPKLDFIGTFDINDKAVTVANSIKDTLGFSDNWTEKLPTWTDALKLLRETMQSKGILVVVNGVVGNNNYRKLNPDECRGFVLIDDYAPLVFVNGSDGKAAQMFTLAHELAHLFLGESAAFDLRGMLPATVPIEEVCNRVAAEFLIPEKKLKKIWNDFNQQSEPFQELARIFKVSSLVSARRALDLNLISKTVFFDFYNAYLEDERRQSAKKSSGGDFYSTQNLRIGKLFADCVIHATKEGSLLYSEAYRLTGLYGKTFENYEGAFVM